MNDPVIINQTDIGNKWQKIKLSQSCILIDRKFNMTE